MKEYPILFSGEMVRAILDGRKTQTRWVMKPQPEQRENESVPGAYGTFFRGWNIGHWAFGIEDILKYCPYGKPGDQLWVRETWLDTVCGNEIGYVMYRADLPLHWDAKDTEHGDDVDLNPKDFKWKPSIFMPRDYSRILLEVTDVRVERVQDLGLRVKDGKGWDEIFAEGIPQSCVSDCKDGIPTPLSLFIKLWDSINGKPRKDGVDISWKANPWIWVVEFKRV